MQPHPAGAERPYAVVQEVALSPMDYENFITDFYADRPFLRSYFHLCSHDKCFRCLLVQCRGRRDGVLVLPVEGGFVGYAAYYPGPIGLILFPD